MSNTDRRYDIDWLRILAIILLLVYHIALIFQSWGKYVGVPQNEQSSLAIWIPMSMFNIWRIPLLFFVSGMGVCFALRRRDWKALLLDRAQRILLPLVFGSFIIVPIHILLYQNFYGEEIAYTPSVGHLWFLLNICIYITQIIGLAFLDKSYDYKFFNFFRNLLQRPYFIYLFIIPFILEAELANPDSFALYVGNSHGFLLGMLAFPTGFLFVALGDVFWEAVKKLKILSLTTALILYIVRLLYFDFEGPLFLTSIESMCWIFALLGFGYSHFNKPGKLLSYLSPSVYPVYIIHMIFLYLASYLILPLELATGIKFVLIIILTFTGCYATYELVIRRINFIRPLFGLKLNK